MRFRCKTCGHTPKRLVTATSKRRSGGIPDAPKLHKKPCHCECHSGVTSCT